MGTPASTANNSDQVNIGANGTVYIGEVAATAPTSEVSSLGAAYKPLGLITPDGVKISDAKNVQEKGAWQTRYPVKRWVTGRAYEISFTLEQLNWLTFKFAMGGGTITEPTNGHYKYVPPSPDELDEHCMVVDWDNDGLHYRIFVPKGLVTAPVELDVKADDTIMLPIVFGAIYDGSSPIYSFFTDDPAFEEYSS